jgi:hypothetical protein
MPRIALIVILTALTAGLGGCATDRHYSQTELNALESREFDADFDRTFDAAIATMFDFGYSIRTSDKRGGFISAGAIQLKIDPAGPRRTSVRVSTSSGGQVRVDKATIDKVLTRIDQRLTASSKPAGAR